MSKETSALVGKSLLASFSMIYLSMPNCKVLMMTSMPPPMPIAKLKGSKNSAKDEEYSRTIRTAVILGGAMENLQLA